MKNLLNDPNKVLHFIKELEVRVEQPLFELQKREDIQVKIRVDEKVAPAMFKPDPLVPGGYLANSLTIKAMRPDIFILGDSIEDALEDLSFSYQCSCGRELDLQFWKLCPYCSREVNP